MRENTDQKNSEKGHFPRSDCIDIFMVWTNSEKQPKDFMKEPNQKHPSIKLN